MPTYDYRCNKCHRRVSIYMTYAEYGVKQPACPHCGSADLNRLLNRVRFARSEEERLDALADPSSWGALDEEDPRAMGRMMRKMSRELGEDLPPEFDEVVGRLEAGESPEKIERSIPELGDGESFGEESSS